MKKRLMREWRNCKAAGRKVFFFEKKNQKTFAYWLRRLAPAAGISSDLKWQRFFGSFFQNRTSSFLLFSPPRPTGYRG
jgi:hypothetical protein